MYTLYYGRYWLVSNIYKNIVSFTYFAIMEDLDKNVFFCQNWEHIYTLIVDVDIDRILIFKTQGILPF